jgi:hypothetical protein
LKLQERVPVVLSENEHARYLWLSAAEAITTVSSDSNRAVILKLRH